MDQETRSFQLCGVSINNTYFEETSMKRSLGLLSIFTLIAIGCSGPEGKLTGTWTNAEVKGFTAEFNKDHTGSTATPIPGHGGSASTQNAKTPFKWAISKDGKITITEDKTEFSGKLAGKKLELEINGAIVVLDKAK